MNFTREPIIETIITPKEGYKLVVRNTKGSNVEEYIVDAIEVVSFGHSFFFRSLERPKSFLVPVSDYEITETKETRVVLKNASFERNIKIGGGAKPKIEPEKQEQPAAVEERLEKKRERRRHRRRRGGSEEIKEKTDQPKSSSESVEGGGASDETKVSSQPSTARLIPPPTKLISESLPKAKDTPKAEENILSKPVDEQKRSFPKHEDTESGGETQRMANPVSELVTSTSFSTLIQNQPFGKIW